MVAALAAGSFALTGVTVLGALADQAAPGQILYPVDRVFESAADFVGIARDRSEERLEELIWVIDRGDQDAAVRFLPEVVVAVERSTGITAPAAPISARTEAATVAEPAATVNDHVVALKLAAEALLQGVRTAGTDETVDIEAAATDLFLVAEQLGEEPVVAAAPDTTTTTVGSGTSVPADSTTTTTVTDEPTTTTVPEGESTTTTTIQPSSNDGGQGSGGPKPGPIILPPLP